MTPQNALKKIARLVGGCPETGDGWENCQVCHGHPDHKPGCAILVLRQYIEGEPKITNPKGGTP